MSVALLYNGANLLLRLVVSDKAKRSIDQGVLTLENSSFSSHSRSWGTDLSRKNLAFSATPAMMYVLDNSQVGADIVLGAVADYGHVEA